MNHELGTVNSKGFTLLELLVVLAIIGILTAIGTVSFTAAQIRARDSQRKSDLKVIASVLETYFQENKAYPESGSGSCPGGASWFCSNSAASPWIPALTTNYIQKLPKDLRNLGFLICNPLNGTNNLKAALVYAYYSAGAAAGKQYVLAARLENDKDPEIGRPIRFNNLTYSNHGCYAITSP